MTQEMMILIGVKVIDNGPGQPWTIDVGGHSISLTDDQLCDALQQSQDESAVYDAAINTEMLLESLTE